MSLLVVTGAGMGAVALGWLEWRRPDKRRLAWRLAATAATAGSLAMLARPTSPTTAGRASTEAALWTFNAQGTDAHSGPFDRFVLPDATHAAALDAKVIPDVAALRRRRPDLQSFVIYGDGLDPADLPALDGLHVEFYPPEQPVAATPSVVFLRCPRTLALGEPLVVAGRLGGVPSGSRFPLVLEAPDGSKIEAVADAADAAGEAAFTMHAPAPAAAGRYTWQLRVGRFSEPLGVTVVAPVLPRVLVLEASPRFDTAALRRWYEGAGGTLTVRTEVGQRRFRYAVSRGVAPQFAVVDAALLTGYDLVLADGHALAALEAGERDALLGAVEKRGLGLLVNTDDAVMPGNAKIPSNGLEVFAPWKLTPADDTQPNDERLVRPRWRGQASASELPVAAVPVFIEPSPNQETLIDDHHGHALVASERRGRGQLALTLVGDTTRWQRGNDFAAFAAYWSFLFERLSGLANGEAGRWSLVDGDGGPVFVDHPLQLRRTGSPEDMSDKGVVVESVDGSITTLSLAQDPGEPGARRGTFWPRHGGWHRVADKSGDAGLDFFVGPADGWPALRSARRRSATARFADASRARRVEPPAARSQSVSPGWWWAVFMAGAGYLWAERRFVAAPRNA